MKVQQSNQLINPFEVGIQFVLKHIKEQGFTKPMYLKTPGK